MTAHTQKMEGALRQGPVAAFSLILLALGLSVAFPYGVGIVIFVWLIALAGAFCGAGMACYGLVKNLFGKTATFGYSPATTYMAGKKTKKTRPQESPEEADKENR